jgi:hypothetical protein
MSSLTKIRTVDHPHMYRGWIKNGETSYLSVFLNFFCGARKLEEIYRECGQNNEKL